MCLIKYRNRSNICQGRSVGATAEGAQWEAQIIKINLRLQEMWQQQGLSGLVGGAAECEGGSGYHRKG